nr:uncharacterized protein LOC123756605 [Procambarus clarkii]
MLSAVFLIAAVSTLTAGFPFSRQFSYLQQYSPYYPYPYSHPLYSQFLHNRPYSFFNQYPYFNDDAIISFGVEDTYFLDDLPHPDLGPVTSILGIVAFNVLLFQKVLFSY